MRVYNRKYPKVTGWWVYGHITPDNNIYIGKSGAKLCSKRWQISSYKNNSLQPYIDKYGWDNIKHIVFKDGLTQKQAEQLEDLLITQAKIDGWCINVRNSGGESRDNPKDYFNQYYKDHKEKINNRCKEYNKTHTKEQKQYKKKYNDNHRKDIIENKKNWRSTTEGKIYTRVTNYNRHHTPIETPLEAKQKYLENGYIPNYIKNDDLIIATLP